MADVRGQIKAEVPEAEDEGALAQPWEDET